MRIWRRLRATSPRPAAGGRKRGPSEWLVAAREVQELGSSFMAALAESDLLCEGSQDLNRSLWLYALRNGELDVINGLLREAGEPLGPLPDMYRPVWTAIELGLPDLLHHLLLREEEGGRQGGAEQPPPRRRRRRSLKQRAGELVQLIRNRPSDWVYLSDPDADRLGGSRGAQLLQFAAAEAPVHRRMAVISVLVRHGAPLGVAEQQERAVNGAHRAQALEGFRRVQQRWLLVWAAGHGFPRFTPEHLVRRMGSFL